MATLSLGEGVCSIPVSLFNLGKLASPKPIRLLEGLHSLHLVLCTAFREQPGDGHGLGWFMLFLAEASTFKRLSLRLDYHHGSGDRLDRVILRNLTKTRHEGGKLRENNENILLPQLTQFELNEHRDLDPQRLVDFVHDRHDTLQLLKLQHTWWSLVEYYQIPECIRRVKAAGR